MGREILRDITGNVIVFHLKNDKVFLSGGKDSKSLTFSSSSSIFFESKSIIINIRTIMRFKQDSFIVYPFSDEKRDPHLNFFLVENSRFCKFSTFQPAQPNSQQRSKEEKVHLNIFWILSSRKFPETLLLWSIMKLLHKVKLSASGNLICNCAA